jgi:hypothetical protein
MTLSRDCRTFLRGSTVASGSAPGGCSVLHRSFLRARAYGVWAVSRRVGVFANSASCQNGNTDGSVGSDTKRK